MNAAQQAALEAVVERSLTPAEIIAIDQLLPLRNDVEIAAILSADRFIYVPHEIGERGIIDALGPVAGDAFLSALEAINSADLLPLPLQPYFGALRRGVAWLKTDGLDIGAKTTRDLLAALAAAGIVDAAAVAVLEAIPRRDNPLHFNVVSDALNIAEGRLTLNNGV